MWKEQTRQATLQQKKRYLMIFYGNSNNQITKLQTKNIANQIATATPRTMSQQTITTLSTLGPITDHFHNENLNLQQKTKPKEQRQ